MVHIPLACHFFLLILHLIVQTLPHTTSCLYTQQNWIVIEVVQHCFGEIPSPFICMLYYWQGTKGKYLWEPLLPSRCTLDCLLYFKINKKVNKQHSEHQSTCSAHYITKHQQVAHCIMKWQQVNCKINKNVINKKVNIKTSWNSKNKAGNAHITR